VEKHEEEKRPDSMPADPDVLETTETDAGAPPAQVGEFLRLIARVLRRIEKPKEEE